MRTIILSIKPEYAERIIAGTKKYEYRKQLAKSDVDTILFYCTVPICKVVASAKVEKCLAGSPTAIWEKTKNYSGITRNKYRSYFEGCNTAYAYQLGELSVFDEPKELSEFGIKTVPQSFVYVD